jgi:hypothetical protein
MMKYSDRPNAYINAKDLEIAIIKTTSYGDALDAVREAPSIKIVRCRECKYDGTWKCPWRNTQVPRYPSANDFCSYGERKE